MTAELAAHLPLIESKQRATRLSEMRAAPEYDVVVVGGGIHGATLAALAAASGLSVLLLEKWDYAFGTSSRSSKMAHGGLRYLELFDFGQVFEGIRAREKLFADFPFMVQPYRFAVPVLQSDWWFRVKLGAGLWLYDLLVRKREHRHRWVPAEKLEETGFTGSSLDLMGCYLYTDGILQDARLVQERIHEAEAQGAHCLNYAAVTGIACEDGNATVTWHDRHRGTEYRSSASFVFNCAGPWAPLLQGGVAGANNNSVRYSRGIHLLFNVPWLGPALFLPMEGVARYYFVWPHPAGTMVGTTELDTKILDDDPAPTTNEIEEVLQRVQRDLPGSRLTIDTLHYAFAGVRTLPLRQKKNGDSARLSRKHIWQQNDALVTLYGGKLTTAEWTARDGLERIAAQRNWHIVSSIPVAATADQELTDWKLAAQVAGLSAEKMASLLARYGRRVAAVFTTDASYRPLFGSILQGEVEYAIEAEQACSIQDILCRRLGAEYEPGAALAALPAIIDYLEASGRATRAVLERQADEYRTLVERSRSTIATMRSASTS